MASKKTRSESRRVLAFNAKKRLSAVYASRLQASKALECQTRQINNACDGALVTFRGMYLRWWDPTIDIEVFNELGQLSVIEYDELCEQERRYSKIKTRVPKEERGVKPRQSRRIKRKSNESKDSEQIQQSAAPV